MLCGGLYECTVSDIVLNGLAVFGMAVWVVAWFMHTVAIVYARKKLFSDAKKNYLAVKARMAKKESIGDQRSEWGRSQQWSLLHRLLDRTRRVKDSSRHAKGSNGSIVSNSLEEVLVDSPTSKADGGAATELNFQNPHGSRTPLSTTDELPGVSVLKPVCGVDAALKENLESFFLLDYPRFELLFCVHSEGDPAIALIRDLMAKYSRVDSNLLIGAKTIGVNPKINNMHQGYERAKYDLVLVSDSGLVTQPETLTQLVYEMLSDDQNGVVHQLPFINLDVYARPAESEVKTLRDEWMSSTKFLKSNDALVSGSRVEMSKSVAFASLDGELHKSKSVCGDEDDTLRSSGSASSVRKSKVAHKHSMSVDMRSASRFAIPQRSYEAHDDVRERSTQSDWTELDLQLGDANFSANQQRLNPGKRLQLTAFSTRQGLFAAESQQTFLSVSPSNSGTPEPNATTIRTDTTKPHKSDVQSSNGAVQATELLVDTQQKVLERVPQSIGSQFSAFVAALQVVYFGTQHARMYLTAQALGITCMNGMSTLIRRKALDACGGLSAFADYLAEDYFMVQRLLAAGYKAPMCSRVALQNSHVSSTTNLSQFEARLQRWYTLRISMLPMTILLEPLGECIPVGALASWSLAHLADYYLLHPLAIFLLHLLVWFFFDYLLVNIVARSAHVRPDSTSETLSGESFCYARAPSASQRLLLFSKTDLLAAWLYRECTSLALQLRSLPRRHIFWRNKVYRVRWGGFTEQI